MAPLMSLWGDGWFYVSGGGFLVSCLLFVFLLGQYRAAIEAEEDAEPSPAPASGPAEKVYIPRPIEPIARIPEPMPSIEAVAPVIAPVMRTVPEPAPALEPAPKPAEKTAEKKKSESTTTGGLSPAVVYLQNLKTQVDHLDKELGSLKGLASNQNSQGELILNRLAELVSRLEALETRAPAAAPVPEPASEAPPAPEPEPEPQPQSVVLQPAPSSESAPEAAAAEPESEPVAAQPEPAAAEPAADNTIVIDPATEQTASVEAPAPEAAAPEAEPKPARKGPVWPI